MGQGIIDAWYEFWGFVKDVLEAVWSVIEWVFTELLPTILVGIGVIVGGITVLALFAPSAAAALVTGIVEITTGIVLLSGKIIGATISTITATIGAFSTGFATLLDLINFQAILDIHSILMIVSDEYRALMAQLFDAISEVSEAIFGNTWIMHMMFRSTENLIIATHAALGWTYEESQFKWLVSLDEVTMKINEKAEDYMERPELLLDDLQEWVDENAVDYGASGSDALIKTQGTTIQFLEGLALNLNSFHRDYEAFRFALPGERGRDIGRAIEPINLRLGAFQFSSYERHRLETGWMVKNNREGLERNRRTLQGIQWDTSRPSRSFGKIEDLPEDERHLEEEIIENYSSRELGRDNETLVGEHDKRIEQEDKEKIREDVFLPPPSWQAITEKEVKELAMEKSKRRDSPFVGDY